VILTQTIPPTAEPLSLTEAKLHLRVDSTADDTLISGLIRAAREYAELVTRRQLVTATHRLDLDQFSDPILLPRPPLAQVTGITYLDPNGVRQTCAGTVYELTVDPDGSAVRLAYNQSWPSIRMRDQSVQITYTSGYATPFVAAADTNVLTVSGRTFADGDAVRLSNSGGTLPAGLAAATTYYVVGAVGATIQLAATAGGSAIDLTDAGTGQHYVGEVPDLIRAGIKLMLGHLYEHREAVVTGTIVAKMPLAVDSLLMGQRSWFA
jgi:uncharacterized phiE125 gp8 family phage protein